MDDEPEIERVLPSAHRRARDVLSGPERRRRWSTEEKLRVLEQSIAPGSSVSLTCRLHGIRSGQLYTLRKQFRLGELTGFLPVSIAAEVPRLQGSGPAVQSPEAATTGLIADSDEVAQGFRFDGAQHAEPRWRLIVGIEGLAGSTSFGWF